MRVGRFSALFSGFRALRADDFEADPYLRAVRPETARRGRFTLTTATYARGELLQYAMPELDRPVPLPKIGYFDREGRFPAIYEDEMPWMSVCPSEISSMRAPVAEARGRVLTLGLGLGYYPFMVSAKEEVERVTVVERQSEVIDLFCEQLLPHFPNADKIEIVQADAYDYVEKLHSGEYDMCFADIYEGAGDGAEAYARLRELSRNVRGTQFSYWIEKEIRWYLTEVYGG